MATLVALVGMAGFVAVGMPAGESPAAQVAALAAGGTAVYRWGFVFAIVLNLSLVAMVVTLLHALAAWRGLRATDVIGGALMVVYLPLTLAAYATQLTVLPALLEEDPAAAATWLFGAAAAVPTVLDYLGYAVWGIGAVVVAVDLVRRPGRLAAIGWLLAAAGTTSVAGFVGLAAGSGVATALTAVGGALIAPLAGVIAWYGLQAYTSVRTRAAMGGES